MFHIMIILIMVYGVYASKSGEGRREAPTETLPITRTLTPDNEETPLGGVYD